MEACPLNREVFTRPRQATLENLMRMITGLMLFVLVSPAFAQKPEFGDAVIRNKAGISDITITTTKRLAGAIHSLTWGGKEFIDSLDHGRQLQSACSFDAGLPGPFWAECYNPTEAGSRRDGAGPRSTSQLLYLKATPDELLTVNRPAFWLTPEEKSSGKPALNRTVLSDHLISKQVKIGVKNLAHAIDYRVTFTIPPGERHTLAQFEALTGYMPKEFSKFYTFNPKTGQLEALSDGPGEQDKPVVLSTPDGTYAMGIWSPEPLSRGFENSRYGRFRFGMEQVVKWNCVFRVKNPEGVKAGNYSYQMYVAVGSLKNVQDTMNGLVQAFPLR
jgi:hypothetical protein